MAITCTSLTFTMTDAEFAKLNQGVAAPTIDPRGSLAALESLSGGAAVTASSSAGTTTVTLASNNRSAANIRTLAQRMRRAAQLYRITYTA